MQYRNAKLDLLNLVKTLHVHFKDHVKVCNGFRDIKVNANFKAFFNKKRGITLPKYNIEFQNKA